MKYGISNNDKIIIADFINNHEKLSIFLLMEKLQCTPEKAVYIFTEIIQKNQEEKNAANS